MSTSPLSSIPSTERSASLGQTPPLQTAPAAGVGDTPSSLCCLSGDPNHSICYRIWTTMTTHLYSLWNWVCGWFSSPATAPNPTSTTVPSGAATQASRVGASNRPVFLESVVVFECMDQTITMELFEKDPDVNSEGAASSEALPHLQEPKAHIAVDQARLHDPHNVRRSKALVDNMNAFKKEILADAAEKVGEGNSCLAALVFTLDQQLVSVTPAFMSVVVGYSSFYHFMEAGYSAAAKALQNHEVKETSKLEVSLVLVKKARDGETKGRFLKQEEAYHVTPTSSHRTFDKASLEMTDFETPTLFGIFGNPEWSREANQWSRLAKANWRKGESEQACLGKWLDWLDPKPSTT